MELCLTFQGKDTFKKLLMLQSTVPEQVSSGAV